MKRISILFFTAIFSLGLIQAQTEIKWQFHGVKADSLKIQAFDKSKKMTTIYAQSYANEMVYKSKISLEPGLYWVLGDSSLVDAFLISSAKGQKFSAVVDTNKITYTGSPENINYHSYIDELQRFDNQIAGLNQEFQEAQMSMPQYMLQVFADSLTARAQRITASKEAYQRKMMAENPGSLLASVIAAGIEPPQPPKEYYQDPSQKKLKKFFMEHYFDNFPWEDPRILNTAIADNKIKGFCNYIYQFDMPELDTCIIKILEAATVNETSLYEIFDRMEKILGSNVSPYKMENSYIKMLRYMLSYKKLEAARKTRYEHELSIIDKNHTGDILPDFRIVMSNGDTTTFHQVKSDYMLLYLQHPTCPTCREVRGRMANFPALTSAIAKGNLKVLTVYFEDDANVWKNFIHSSEANPSYLHGWNYDQTIEEKNLYDTRTIPFMFLIDKDKKVIRKDILVNEIEDYIKKLHLD
ncbi:MAG: DUF5106 domain-containing protein [Bacteroidales bacterium]|nr:DUF5106 domain-containing protein [Bacteroidales bacterium]